MESDDRASTLTAPAASQARAHEQPATKAVQATKAERPATKEQVTALLFDAFNRRDLESALGLLHPEIVFQPMTAAAVGAGEPYRGYEGIRRYVEDVDAFWEELTLTPVQIRAAGQAVVVLGEASGRSSLGAFEGAATTWVLKFRDELVVHAQIFSDGRHVREALGTDS